MGQTSKASDFGYLQAAARLRVRLERWREDQAFLERGGRVFYATDADVVKLFLNPQNRLPYATVFAHEGDDAREVVARVLARFIFYRLTGEAPLLLIPPHSVEIQRIAAAIDRDVARLADSFQPEIESIGRLRDTYLQTGNETELIQGIAEHAIGVVRLLYGAGIGPAAEACRMAELLRDGRLLHMERYIDEQDQWVAPILYDDVDDGDRNILKGLQDVWKERLKAHKSQARKEYRIDDDAEALARLEWANTAAKPQHRLILISGDQALQHAAATHAIPPGKSFQDLYIRDPRDFLSATVQDLLPVREMGEPGSTGPAEQGLIGWLDLLFSRFEPQAPDYLHRLKTQVIELDANNGDELAHQFSRHDPDWAERLRSEWTDLVNLAAVHAGMVANHALAERFAQDVAGMESDALRDRIKQHIFGARSELWRSGMDAGFWSFWLTAAAEVQDTDLPSRGAPALRFPPTGCDKAKEFADYLVRTLRREATNDGPPSMDDLLKEDPSGYTAYLVHALGFAVAGRWSTTEVLARLALEEADRQIALPHKDTPLDIRGIDAAYLLSIALRHIARDPSDLEQVRMFLQEADRRAAGETDLRLVEEGIAIDLTYHHFRLFMEVAIPGSVPSLRDCQERLLELRGQLGQERNDTIRAVLEKQVLTNIFSVFLLRRYKENVEKPAAGANVTALLERFTKILGAPSQQALRSATG
jgi:hypothetical protein